MHIISTHSWHFGHGPSAYVTCLWQNCTHCLLLETAWMFDRIRFNRSRYFAVLPLPISISISICHRLSTDKWRALINYTQINNQNLSIHHLWAINMIRMRKKNVNTFKAGKKIYKNNHFMIVYQYSLHLSNCNLFTQVTNIYFARFLIDSQLWYEVQNFCRYCINLYIEFEYKSCAAEFIQQ